MINYIVRNCDRCNKEDSINTETGLCSSCDFDDLKRTIELKRQELGDLIPIKFNRDMWKLVNELIELEIEAEKECNR